MDNNCTRQNVIESPFHSGEQAVQSRVGVREMIEPWARKVVLPYLVDQHRNFYSQLPFLVLAARDPQGLPWVTIVAGEPGFAHSHDPGLLSVAVAPSADDALGLALADNDDIGVLGIELHTRRRNRMNGRIIKRNANDFQIEVIQAFGNCPQYIQDRQWQPAPVVSPLPAAQHHRELTPSLQALVQAADTFFIASGHRGEGDNPAFGMDASHRGGAPGFVRVLDPNTLVIPDYAGNNHFNTLGNLAIDPGAGLLFVDFESGDMLQLTGHAYIDWDEPDQNEYPGARRLLRFELDAAVERKAALPLRFENPGGSVRELRLIDKRVESADVSSFIFAARDGGTLAGFSAGQHLPIELGISGQVASVSRTYSLSSSPLDSNHYRITVKRDPKGLVSRLLHDQLEIGNFINANPPQGDFVLEHEGTGPIVLLSAGVGLTPMVSMLHALAGNTGGRPIWFIHSARDSEHHPLREEVRRLAATDSNITLHTAYSQPLLSDASGKDYDSHGRIDSSLLSTLIQSTDADYYLCGPLKFMTSIQQQLEDHGVASKRIRYETFGPAA